MALKLLEHDLAKSVLSFTRRCSASELVAVKIEEGLRGEKKPFTAKIVCADLARDGLTSKVESGCILMS